MDRRFMGRGYLQMKRPNILILYTDQQRWDALGANGNLEIKTPHLDQLAAEGVNFTHYFVQNPVCMPSRVSFLTGQYPSALRITHMGVPVPEDTITLPKMLKNYGYVSANIGKLHFLPHANLDHRNIHPDYGFDQLEISDEPGVYEDAYRAWVRSKMPEQLDNVSLGLPPAAETWMKTMRINDGIKHPEERFPKKAVPFPGDSEMTHTAFVAEQTLQFMEQNCGKSWLCVAGFYSPHSPWITPQKFLDMYDPGSLTIPKFPSEMEKKRSEQEDFSDPVLRSVRHGYYAMISEVDYQIGRILDSLEKFGLAEDTIVIFTSDHGEWLGEHLLYGKSYPGHDAVSRVPFIVRWPGGIKQKGRTVSEIVEAVDVVPTLLECAGIQAPAHLQGYSLKPLLEGKEPPCKKAALMEHAGWKNLRTERYRYVSEVSGKEMIFDLEKDPSGYVDLAADPEYARVLSEMRVIMLQRLLEMERPLPRTWAY
jgi:arylsulfatase A-like enzyme